MHQFGAAAGGSFPEIGHFERHYAPAACGGSDGDTQAGGSITDDNQILLFVGVFESFQ